MPTHVLDPAFANLRREFDAACNLAAIDARKELLQALNQLFRRFRSYQTENDWVQTTLDAASPYANQVALFSVTNDTLTLRGQMPSGLLPAGLSFPISQAAAFKNVIEAKDTVTALRTPSEVSEVLSRGNATERGHFFPITNSNRVSAILFASDTASDVNALELVAGIASSVLERKANAALHSQIGFAPQVPEASPVVEHHEAAPPIEVQAEAAAIPEAPAVEETLAKPIEEPVLEASVIEPSAPEPPPQPAPEPPPAPPVVAPKLPAWADLPVEQRQLHIRAQRFARVTVAELQLARPEACRAGREQGDLYLFLKREIDKARENYRKQFMTVPSMVDYLHLELIQTAAQGDEQKLGADYPGRLL